MFNIYSQMTTIRFQDKIMKQMDSYVEKNKELAQIAQHNFNLHQQHNIEVKALSAEDFLSRNKKKYNLVFITIL